MVDFGDKLKQLRTLKGLSQEQLAKRMSITKSMVSAYENSVRLPSYDVLIKIALFFNTCDRMLQTLRCHFAAQCSTYYITLHYVNGTTHGR